MSVKDAKAQRTQARVYLAELEAASKLPLRSRQRYLAAYHSLIEGCHRLAAQDLIRSTADFENSMRELSATLGDECTSAAYAEEQLGSIYLIQDEGKKARDILVRASAIRKKLYGEDHPAYSNSLMLVGAAYNATSEFSKAQVVLREGLALERSVSGRNSLQYANGILKLSQAMIGQRMWPEAESLCLHALLIAKSNENALPNRVVRASGLANLAEIAIAHDEFNDAELNLRYVLEIYDSLGLSSGSASVRILERYAFVLEKLGRLDEAKAYRTKAEKAREILRSASYDSPYIN